MTSRFRFTLTDSGLGYWTWTLTRSRGRRRRRVEILTSRAFGTEREAKEDAERVRGEIGGAGIEKERNR